MRNRIFWLSLAVMLLMVVAAPHLSAQPTQGQQTSRLDAVTIWKIANTALFAAFLAFVIRKYAPAFFNARSLTIQKAIQEATGLRIDAEFRYSEIDRKMATLADEIRSLRTQELADQERDHEVFLRETEGARAHIRRNADAEIEAYRREGIRQVKWRTADRALQVAERRIREHSAAHEPQELVEDFLHIAARRKTG